MWRGGTGRQARLAKALGAIDVVPLDEGLGRRAGVLLARCGLTDAIDAALVSFAGHGDQIFTSDPDNIATLAAVSNQRIDVIPV